MAINCVKSALVVGCAANVWDDVAAAQSLCTFDAVYCVKLSGVHWPNVFQVWVTLHPELMDGYERERHALGRPNGYEIVAHAECKTMGEHYAKGRRGNVSRYISYRWPGMTSSASSGIFAAKVALDDGFERVVLAGIPMDKSNHFSRGKPWLQQESFIRGFEKATPFLKGRVKSMSGYTREVLGAPSAEWLAGSGDLNRLMGEMPAH